MNFAEFWAENSKEIIISSLFALVSIGLLLFLSFIQKKENKRFKSILIGLLIILMIVGGVTYSLLNVIDKETNQRVLSISHIALIDTIIIAIYSVISFVMVTSHRVENTGKRTTISKIALTGIIVGLSSVLMLFGIPIMPSAEYLKLEISALVYFMVLIWFDYKTAIIVSLLTNIIHVIMPSSTAPLIIGLDEMVNFIANMAYILPAAIIFRKLKTDEKPSQIKIIMSTVIGTIFTIIFMVSFNAFINLPFVYHIELPFKDVLYIFGIFNVIKWGVVTITICYLWPLLYNLKNLVYRK